MDSSLLDGEPAAMRIFAAFLQQTAEAVSHVAAWVGTRSGSAVFEGPAADRFRREIADLDRTDALAARELSDLAARLGHLAGEVEAAQAEERRREQQAAEEAARAQALALELRR